MAGVTKHIFEHDIRDILSMWDTQLKCIQKVLPKEYSHEDIVEALKLYYPHEWFSVEMKYLYYTKKDKYLVNRFGKARYNMVPAEQLLRRAKQYQFLMSTAAQLRYTNGFSEKLLATERQALWAKREPKIQVINEKIDRAKSKVQQVTPAYIDQLIGLYERKNTSQKDRVYILAELKKYYSPKIVQFFYKLNDTELNSCAGKRFIICRVSTIIREQGAKNICKCILKTKNAGIILKIYIRMKHFLLFEHQMNLNIG